MLQACPPEKYYEACITYHLVRYFHEIYDRALYPFCVSQVKEKQLGFDFGYRSGQGGLFLIQYKRPQLNTNGRYTWPIHLQQLETLLHCGLPAFYAFPAFSKADQWYEGLDKTYFISAGQVRFWLQNRPEQKNALLREDERLFQTIPPRAFDPFARGFESALRAEADAAECPSVESLLRLPGAQASEVCGYWIAG